MNQVAIAVQNKTVDGGSGEICFNKGLIDYCRDKIVCVKSSKEQCIELARHYHQKGGPIAVLVMMMHSGLEYTDLGLSRDDWIEQFKPHFLYHAKICLKIFERFPQDESRNVNIYRLVYSIYSGLLTFSDIGLSEEEFISLLDEAGLSEYKINGKYFTYA